MSLFKYVLLSTACLMTVSVSGFSGTAALIQCPSASAIQQQKISQAIGYLPGLYMGMEENHYGTNMEWRFNLGPIMGHTESQVIAKSNEELKTLSGPISQTSTHGEPLCVYKTKNPGNSAIATLIKDE